jgi:hypothetical protein
MALITQKHETLYQSYFMDFFNSMMRIGIEKLAEKNPSNVASVSSSRQSNCDDDPTIQIKINSINECIKEYIIKVASVCKSNCDEIPTNSIEEFNNKDVIKVPSVGPSLQSNCEETFSNNEKLFIDEVIPAQRQCYRGLNSVENISKTKEQLEFLNKKYKQTKKPSKSLLNDYAEICGLPLKSVNVSFS